MTRTKIVATIGPASMPVLDALLAEVDVIRLNFSHGTHESHAAVFERARRAGRAVMQDLCGPKIRTRMMEGEGVNLVDGEKTIVTFRGKPTALVIRLTEDQIEDIVFTQASFLKDLDAVEREAVRKGSLSTAEVRQRLSL